MTKQLQVSSCFFIAQKIKALNLDLSLND